MQHAFPEDELRPITCTPLTRDRERPSHIEVNDVLGNYSLTLIDSLSTLAILASSDLDYKRDNRALQEFQDGIASLVELYGTGEIETQEDGAQIRAAGTRSRGFDLDSKVQVFETTIRGVGGLLSAHQFAVGDLPIRGYAPYPDGVHTGKISWNNGFDYDGQLLWLAHDLAERLLPAFHTATGIPYPRVNLRSGVPFYMNSPLNAVNEDGQCPADDTQCRVGTTGAPEITETCSAGAGSLVLEFSTLSRLTGDLRFERAAKQAYFSVWKYRTNTGLIGSGIDAESGNWIQASTGIGAGIDSFFEYALKSHILLSGLPDVPLNETWDDEPDYDAADFLRIWEDARASIDRHIYRSEAYQHPHYIQADLYTGATKAFWIDSLSAYYPGLLVLAGDVEKATSTHLLYSALWTRYSAMPERWSTASGNIEAGLSWWGGRPEFIESTWYLYRATKDPWYIYVGEMVVEDIKRRCWTKCGWAGIQDVRTGELSDRMESFFLGETAKYLYLLFDEDHPLNSWDAAWVFTTEGHPLVMPSRLRQTEAFSVPLRDTIPTDEVSQLVCPVAPQSAPFVISNIVSRPDIFHAAVLARLDLRPESDPEAASMDVVADHPSIQDSHTWSSTNFVYYPWTLPEEYVPWNATSSKMSARVTFDLSFPQLPTNAFPDQGPLQRAADGLVVNTLSNARLGMLKEAAIYSLGDDQSAPENPVPDQLRIYAISNVPLGRDEKVYIKRETMADLNGADPFFTRMKDLTNIELLIDSPAGPATPDILFEPGRTDGKGNSTYFVKVPQDGILNADSMDPSTFSNIISRLFSSFLDGPSTTSEEPSAPTPFLTRDIWLATLPTGPGAAPLPEITEPPALEIGDLESSLPWKSILVLDDSLCTEPISRDLVQNHQILVIKRGDCSFSQKLQQIPSFPPSPSALQLVVVVSYPEHEGDNGLVQPLLQDAQTTLSGLERRNPIPVIMVSGGDEALAVLRKASGLGVRRRYWVASQGVRIANLIVV